MRSPEWLLSALLVIASAGVHAQGAASAPAINAAAVRAAASAVQADPLMPGTEKSKTLRFKPDTEQEKERKKPDEDLNWWMELIGTLSAGLRVAMWLVCAGLFIWVLMRAYRWLRPDLGGFESTTLPPTHVGTLDIRPESLPADIGIAARALWQRGETRGALSLLYRGALSRLVHGHSVPIRAASTEGDCLRLSARRLQAEPQAFLSLLIACWQAVAYAQRQPSSEDLERLCAEFDRQLNPREASAA